MYIFETQLPLVWQHNNEGVSCTISFGSAAWQVRSPVKPTHPPAYPCGQSGIHDRSEYSLVRVLGKGVVFTPKKDGRPAVSGQSNTLLTSNGEQRASEEQLTITVANMRENVC